MNLQERAMLAALHIRRWGGTRTDKKVTSDVAKQHAVTERRAGNYRKHAINVDAPTFKAVVTAASELRARHMHWTLPWGEEGARILPSANFEKYSDEMRAARADFDRKSAEFVTAFPELKAAAKIELNGLYNETDYPKDIAAKFGVELSIMPLPNAADFRVKLPDDAVATIKANIEVELQRTTSFAMREPYERLFAHITRMVDRLSYQPKPTDKHKGIFRDTLVTGLAELCEVLPGLNIMNDPHLDELRRKSEALIAGIDPQSLRDSPTLRATVCAKATEIQNAMAAFMGESTGGES